MILFCSLLVIPQHGFYVNMDVLDSAKLNVQSFNVLFSPSGNKMLINASHLQSMEFNGMEEHDSCQDLFPELKNIVPCQSYDWSKVGVYIYIVLHARISVMVLKGSGNVFGTNLKRTYLVKTWIVRYTFKNYSLSKIFDSKFL